jgi:hypothetical protein
MTAARRNPGGWTLNEVRLLVLVVIPVVLGAHDPTDKFETLCHVHADISAAPSIPQRGSSGKMCYYREFDVVLLVGLTELKAQIRWTDSITVRIHELLLLYHHY